jgi:hypothetical protein
MDNNSKFFCNKDCEYFPCHSNIHLDNFSCLFCFCPLFTFDCKGNFTYIKGKKDCSLCILPHIDYDYIINFLKKDIEEKRSTEI